MRCRPLLLSVHKSVCHAAQLGFGVWGHSVQPLPSHFGLLFNYLGALFRPLSFVCLSIKQYNFVCTLHCTVMFHHLEENHSHEPIGE